MLQMGEINIINSKYKVLYGANRTICYHPLTPGLLLKALYFLHFLLVYSSREGKLLYTQVACAEVDGQAH